MIFTPKHAQMSLDGRKTETGRVRWPEHGTTTVERDGKAVILAVWEDSRRSYSNMIRRTIYRVGKTYSVCPGRGKKSIGRIRILEIRERARLDEVDAETAQREGGYTKESYYELCHTMQSLRKQSSAPAWSIRYEVVR